MRRPVSPSAWRRATPFALCVLMGVLTAPVDGRHASRDAASAAQIRPAAELSRQVDELFRQWQSTTSPGAAVLVMRDGRTVHARGYGMASLEYGVPNRPDTVFDIASVSKQFGAMAVALLEADGRLSLDDDVRRYIGELPDFGSRITLRHLVHHTSGIRDWPGTLALAGWSFEDVLSFSQILRMAYHQRELNFTPGEAHLYSNTGYNLLAEVVARVSGRSFRQFCDERIFKPLGMTRTHFHDDHTEVVANRAESYRPASGGRHRRAVSNLTALGSSSLFTTIEDLAKWIANLHAVAPTVGDRAVVARLHERGRLNSGSSIAYAFGQSIGEYRGVRTAAHSGSWAGYRSVLLRVPDERFAVAILANTAAMNPLVLAQQIVDLYLADRLAAAERTAPPAAPAPAPGAKPWQPTAGDLQAFAGEYRSAELQTSYVLDVREGRLVARHFRTGDVAFRPTEPDRFDAPTFNQVRFLRGSDGAVDAFTATSDRVRHVRFDRVRRVAQPPPATEIYLASFDEAARRVGTPVNITNHPGYDNQPFFLPDSSGLLFASNRDGTQTDIYRYDIATRAVSQVTRTPENEYSPTVTPDRGTFSTVRGAEQRLWRFRLDGSDAGLVLAHRGLIGYHAWISPTEVAVFVLGSEGRPNTLELVNLPSGASEAIESSIGRSLHIRPGAGTLTFVHRPRDLAWTIKELDPKTRKIVELAPTVEGSEDLAWTPAGSIVMGSQSRLWLRRPGGDRWIEIAELGQAALGTITRLAVSPDGRWIAIVSQPAPAS